MRERNATAARCATESRCARRRYSSLSSSLLRFKGVSVRSSSTFAIASTAAISSRPTAAAVPIAPVLQSLAAVASPADAAARFQRKLAE